MRQGKEIPTQSGRAPKPGPYVISSGHVYDALTRDKDERRLRGDQRACGTGGMLRLQTGTLNICPCAAGWKPCVLRTLSLKVSVPWEKPSSGQSVNYTP